MDIHFGTPQNGEENQQYRTGEQFMQGLFTQKRSAFKALGSSGMTSYQRFFIA